MGLICSKITSCRHVVGAKRAQMGTKPAYRPPGPSFATIYTAAEVMAVVAVAMVRTGVRVRNEKCKDIEGVCVGVGMKREEKERVARSLP